MKKKFLQSIVCLSLAFLISCSSGNSQNVLEPKDFKAKIDKDTAAVVVDVRTPSEFADGHLPGALNLDVRNPDFSTSIKGLDTNKTYLLYCRSGARTQKAAEIMQQAGFKNVFGMKGGFPDWEKAGYPVEK